MDVKIKICGLTRMEDIEAVNTAMPDYIGFVFVPSSKRFVTKEQAAALCRNLSDDIQAVGVFVNESKETILTLVEHGIIDLIQLHGSEDEAYIRELKQLTSVPVIKAVSVQSAQDPIRWEQCEADYLLFDHGKGGTGQCFDHSLIGDRKKLGGKKKLGDRKKPYFLAGGLTPENLVNAAENTTPYAVDLSSGVEQHGTKDATKIADAVRRIRHV